MDGGGGVGSAKQRDELRACPNGLEKVLINHSPPEETKMNLNAIDNNAYGR